MFIIHLIIIVVLLVSIIREIKTIYHAVKEKNSAGIVYGLIILMVSIAIFIFVLDYEKMYQVMMEYIKM